MPKPWYKMWTNILEREEFFALNGDQTRHWVMIMAVAQKADDEGRLPPLKSVAFMLRTSEETAQKWIDEMVDLELIDVVRSRYVVHNWKRWQGDGKSDAQRKREQRDRERDMSRDTTVTSHDPVTNGSQPGHSLAGAKTKTTEEEKNKTPPLSPKRGTRRITEFVPPNWIPESVWSEFLAMRVRIKKPATPYAQHLVVKALVKLERDGHDPVAVLEQSIRCDYQDVYPIKAQLNSNHAAASLPSNFVDPRTKALNSTIAAAVAKNIERRKHDGASDA